MNQGLTHSWHAQKRIRQRRITEGMIEDVISGWDVRVTRADGDMEYVGWTGDRWIKVVIAEDVTPHVVVTVHDA
ncbi:MAG: DUF4258 domain-containing protein [Chloroflexi bacterium]|nr:DUF4258 domain-containing protein [Chloroflexota bacterium]